MMVFGEMAHVFGEMAHGDWMVRRAGLMVDRMFGITNDPVLRRIGTLALRTLLIVSVSFISYRRMPEEVKAVLLDPASLAVHVMITIFIKAMFFHGFKLIKARNSFANTQIITNPPIEVGLGAVMGVGIAFYILLAGGLLRSLGISCSFLPGDTHLPLKQG